MSRENQIENIANILWHIPHGYNLNSYNDCEVIAECIYDDGHFRKQSEGEWREDFDGDCYCTSCGYYPKKDVKNFCPYCGAKMKGESDD